MKITRLFNNDTLEHIVSTMTISISSLSVDEISEQLLNEINKSELSINNITSFEYSFSASSDNDYAYDLVATIIFSIGRITPMEYYPALPAWLWNNWNK